MKAHSATTAAVVVCLLAAGCAQDGSLATNGLNTASIEQQQKAAAQAEKTNAECMTLVSQIETLNRDGAAAKVSKAAIKKYKMKSTDLAKADELNKANAEFQTKCSNYPPPTIAVAPETTPGPAAANATPAGAQVAAKSKPPVPAPKPVASALAPQASDSLGQSAEPGQP